MKYMSNGWMDRNDKQNLQAKQPNDLYLKIAPCTNVMSWPKTNRINEMQALGQLAMRHEPLTMSVWTSIQIKQMQWPRIKMFESMHYKLKPMNASKNKLGWNKALGQNDHQTKSQSNHDGQLVQIHKLGPYKINPLDKSQTTKSRVSWLNKGATDEPPLWASSIRVSNQPQDQGTSYPIQGRKPKGPQMT